MCSGLRFIFTLLLFLKIQIATNGCQFYMSIDGFIK